MSKESYVRGFCKAAEEAGVDPHALAKYAQSIIGQTPSAQDISAAKQVYRKAMDKAIGIGNKILNNVNPVHGVRKAFDSVKNIKNMSGRFGNRSIGSSIRMPIVNSNQYGGYGTPQAYQDAYEAFNQ